MPVSSAAARSGQLSSAGCRFGRPSAPHLRPGNGELYSRGVKVLSLFFIDEVSKYRLYDGDSGSGRSGEYAQNV